MSGPRNYGVAAERALYLLSQGTCYCPGCDRAVIVFLEDVPVCDAQFTHISGALPGSARYDPSMTDSDRASFSNLILLCKPHHDLVDRIDPSGHPVSLLKEWKIQREGDTAVDLNALNGLSGTVIEEFLEQFATIARPRRVVAVDVRGGWITPGHGVVACPIDGFREILAQNPSHRDNERVFIATVRCSGELPISIESWDIEYQVAPEGSSNPGSVSLLGRNDFPYFNPPLPTRLESGESADWLTRLSTFRMIQEMFSNSSLSVVSFRAACKLGSGEKIYSDPCSMDALPLQVV